MLMPKRVKRRKVQRGRMKGIATRGNTITYGEFALQALEPSWITSNQIEAARIAMTRYSRRGGQVWIKIFPDKPVTSKPAETRMGSGKGSPDHWVAVVKPGRVLFEIAGVTEEVAREAMRLAAHKLPCRTKFIKRDEPAKETDETSGTAGEAPEAVGANVEASGETVEIADEIVEIADESVAAADETVNAAEEAIAAGDEGGTI